MSYKAVIFDMDGTILETLEDMKDSVNYTLEHFGFETITLAQTRTYVGYGAERLMRRALPENVSEEVYQEALKFYKAYYKEHCQIKTCEYDGITDLLKSLRAAGIKTAVVSNKPDPAVQELAEYFFSGMFDFVVGACTSIRPKPAPDSLYAAVKALGFDKKDCVYIGDTEVDIATTKSAEMDCVSVTWGFRDREQLIEAGASILIDSVAELKACLLN